MRIYVLQEYNAGMTVCISEDIGMIRSQICSKKYFDPKRETYPILSMWENGKEVWKIEGSEVLKRIAKEMRENV